MRKCELKGELPQCAVTKEIPGCMERRCGDCEKDFGSFLRYNRCAKCCAKRVGSKEARSLTCTRAPAPNAKKTLEPPASKSQEVRKALRKV